MRLSEEYCWDVGFQMEKDDRMEKQNEDALRNSPYRDEELLYQSCLNDDREFDDPDISKLKSAKSESSKAWYLFLYMQRKDYRCYY